MVPAYACVLLSFVLPTIPLDGWQANLAVVISNSGTWQQLPFFAALMIVVLVSRPGLDARRRVIEGLGLLAILLVILAGNAELNESVIKPVLAIPRPNLTALADQGTLGIGIDEFYALGDKQARRDYLVPLLEALEQPALSPSVRQHWGIETGYSFPSGHATAAMTFASLMCAAGLRWASGWRLTLATLIPVWAVAVVFTRPLLQVHTPLDVSFGAAVGLVLGVAGFAVLHALVDRFDPNPAPLAPRSDAEFDHG